MATTKTNDDSVIGYTFEDIERMAADVMKQISIRPSVGIICGTGLDGLEDAVENATCVSYSSIPGFPVCTVKGHQGKFVVGDIGGKPVLLMIGRFHYYEGYPIWKVAMPVRVMRAMGIETLIVTNAAGGLDPDHKCGDIMVIRDHVDMLGLTGVNVLRGENDERFGPRFLATNSIYDKELGQQFKKIAKDMGMSHYIKEGVYVMASGPTFNSLTEVRLLRMIGGDAIGMSTIPEAIVGKHGGMRVFAFSLITDVETLNEEDKIELTHDEVLKVGRERTMVLRGLMKTFIANI